MVQFRLGRTLFCLENLTSEQEQLLEDSWGPFYSRDGLLQDTDVSSSSKIWWIEFETNPAPKDIFPHYRRPNDVALLDKSTEERAYVKSWIDGSLGAIEASIQVVL